MFVNEDLKNHIETSSVVRLNSAVIAEWNMNIAENIAKIGNYRYRPLDSSSRYYTIPNSYDSSDFGNFYTNATYSDTVIDGGYDNNNTPVLFQSQKEKENLLFSLEDCFGRFRPRSGICKTRFFEDKHLHFSNLNMARRPRYYLADKDDKFKYWSSYRVEDGKEYGIANQLANSQYYIDDTAPFVVYKESIPVNRVIVKTQTNVGDIDLGPFSNNGGSFSDPFYGADKATTPKRWKIQTLSGTNWTDAISFDQSSTREDGSPVIGSDGYLELQYGLIVPQKYKDIFVFAEKLSHESFLPEQSLNGYAYHLQTEDSDIGIYYVWLSELEDYENFIPEYGWALVDESIDRLTNFVTDLTSPFQFIDPSSGRYKYREFENILGLRVVVESMNSADATFDLIELSPRLAVNLEDKVSAFSVTKNASDLGVSGMPVGQLLASVGSISLFDYDSAFNPNNNLSIISKHLIKNIQFKFYEIVVDVDGYDYFVPIKTMYSEGFPETSASTREVSINLRDLYFYFESITAPEILITNVSLSYAVSLLLDSIGFSNYMFKRVSGESDPQIPYFFIAPDTTIAQVLEELALATQTAMFFDEYNNFIMMSKEFMMPSTTQRPTDISLYGSKDFGQSGLIKNGKLIEASALANIVDISSQDNQVYNSGTINYTSRYIQKSYGTIRQASLLDQEKNWIYKPVLLWEVSGEQKLKSVNNELSSQSGYSLSAIPLNSSLSSSVPDVSNHSLRNNIIDLGEAVYWLGRYNGYFYSSGEVIRYDAIQFSIPGNDSGSLVWISSVQDYQSYFSKLKFNGKIYPTGLVRIYSEPFYEVVNGTTRLKNGPVRKHGRGQFGTAVVAHSAGIDSYWSDNANVQGCTMDSSYLFGSSLVSDDFVQGVSAAGVSTTLARKSTRNGIIKNFLSTSFQKDSAIGEQKVAVPGTVQSSALLLNGPSFSTTEYPNSFISYVFKPLTDKFTHFGTRMRIIGKVESDGTQSPTGPSQYYTVPADSPNQNVTINGGSGGLAFLLNSQTNVGYYFEIIALTERTLEAYTGDAEIANVIFYKLVSQDSNEKAIPVKLWSGQANIVVDDGKFTGQYRMVGEENPTVYDLAVDYEDIGSTRRFYLYLNNKSIAIVDDINPLPIYNNMAIFTRGSSRSMFENLYAISNNYSQNTSYGLDVPIGLSFLDNEITMSESFRKYAMSGLVQSSYISGISPIEPPKYNFYFEEFGSIMREAAHFNVKYDKAYPALYATLSPTFNKIKGYVSSSFIAGPYGAEFLIFNATDTVISLDETTGNYLRIQGITFTQSSEEKLSVDDFFNKRSSFSDPFIESTGTISSPLKYDSDYQNIKASRLTHGINEFSISSKYIQTQDYANDLMKWTISKIMKPRKSLGVSIFANPAIQLGDIVSINYKDESGQDVVASSSSRFSVYSIQYDRSESGPEMTLFLSEVLDD